MSKLVRLPGARPSGGGNSAPRTETRNDGHCPVGSGIPAPWSVRALRATAPPRGLGPPHEPRSEWKCHTNL